MSEKGKRRNAKPRYPMPIVRAAILMYKTGKNVHKHAKTYNFFQKLSQTINNWKVSFWVGVGLPSKNYSMKTIKVKELEVPTGAMPEVVDILIDNEMDNSLTGTDDDHDFIYLEVSYDKDDDDQKAAIHEIEDIIADYEDDDEDEDENKKGE